MGVQRNDDQADYPAAHSMDTTWFAVDRDGHVAEFNGEVNSPVPRLQTNADYTDCADVFRNSPSFSNYYARDLYDRLCVAFGRQSAWQVMEEPVRDVLQTHYLGLLMHDALRTVRRQEPPGMWRDEGLLGMFDYYCDYGCSEYKCLRVPQRPVRIAQFSSFPSFIPQQIRFDALCFAETEHLCPWDWGPCWSYRELNTASLHGDEKPYEVVPTRGREEEFLEDYEALESWAQEAGHRIQTADEFLAQYEEINRRLHAQPWGWSAVLDNERVIRPRSGWEQEFLAGYEELQRAARERGLEIESEEEISQRCEELEEARAGDGEMERHLVQQCEQWLKQYLVTLQPHAEGTVLPVCVRLGARNDRILGVQNGVLHIALTVDNPKARKTLLGTLGVGPSELISGHGKMQKQVLVRGLTPDEVYERMKEPLARAREEAFSDGIYPAGHSMDTTWFAVDRDGHVGIFDRGQNGPAPESWGQIDATRQILEDHGRTDILTEWPKERLYIGELKADYPTGHSMDTTWFAVDRDGHVANFWPCDGGPVPKGSSLDSSSPASACLRAQIESLGISSDIVVDLQGALHILNDRWYGANRIWHGEDERPVWEVRRRRLGRALLIVRSLEVVQEAIQTGDAKPALQRPEGPPFAVEFANLPRDVAKEALRSGECLCCVSLVDHALEAAGVFSYSYGSGEGCNPGPYGRDLAPSEPVTVDRLPSTVRAIVDRVRFDRLSFADAPYVQPLEIVECQGTEHWESYVDVDGRTMLAATGKSPRNLETVQQEWNEHIRETELEREQKVRDLACWPSHRRITPPVPVVATSRWLDGLIAQIEDFREANPTDLVPDLVRVVFEFRTDDLALNVCAALVGEPSIGKQMYRGQSIVCHDADEERSIGPVVHDHAPGRVYAWLDERIQSGRFPKPRVLLGRPRCRPSGEELRCLWGELAGLRERCAAIVEGHIPTRKRRRELEAGPQRDVWETLIALLLRCTGRDFDSLPDYYCYLGEEFVPVMPMTRLGQLAPLLTEATADDWHLLERLVEFLPLTEALQRLRLQVLSILSLNEDLPPEEVRNSLRGIFEDRDEDLSDWLLLEILPWAFELPGLPVAELRPMLRRGIAQEMAAFPGDGNFQALLDRLEQGDYPAAHSMDTTWFAVDQNGHIGHFNTLHNGHYPTDACVSVTAQDSLLLSSARQDAIYPPEGRDHDLELDEFLLKQIFLAAPNIAADNLAGWVGARHIAEPGSGLFRTLLAYVDESGAGPFYHSILMQLGNIGDDLSALCQSDMILRNTDDGCVLWADTMSLRQFVDLHRGKKCVRCVEPARSRDANDAVSAALGLYYFEPVEDELPNCPYEKLRSPTRPLSINDLPPDLGGVLSKIQFGSIDFGDLVRVQPIEFVPCECNISPLGPNAFLSTDMKTLRPVPGREAEYNAALSQLRETVHGDYPGLRIAPLSGGW